MRHRTVAAAPVERNRKTIGRSEERPVADADLAGFHPAVKMQRKRALDVRILQRTFFDHCLGAGRPFLGRLKAEHDRSRDLGFSPRQIARGSEQDRHVPVVPARVHHAVSRGAIGNVVQLLDRQRVHVGAQQRDGTGAPAA